MGSEPELILEDATLLGEAMRHMVRYALDATEALDARIEHRNLDGATDAQELRQGLKRVQNITLEISEQVNAY